ncbi:MAG: Hint domain-containing protein [Sulfitobacter sp.]
MGTFSVLGIDVINNAAIGFTSGSGNDGQGSILLQGGTQLFADDAILVFETIGETADGELNGGSAFTMITVYANAADRNAGIVQYTYTPQNLGQTASIQASGDGLGDTYVRFNANVLIARTPAGVPDPTAPVLSNLMLLPGTDAGDNIGSLVIDRNTDVDFNGDGTITPGPVEEGNNLFFTGPLPGVICFTPGTRIATKRGEVPVEQLREGDLVLTRDNGQQELRWVGRRNLDRTDLTHTPAFSPIMIQAGALGEGMPQRDMMVSPNHRMLVTSKLAELLFGEHEVLAAAKHLTGLDGVNVALVSNVSYIHIMFDRHEVVLADGVWAESFQPGDQSMAGIGDAQRQEILQLFPGLSTVEGVDAYVSARRSLKRYEAELLTK